MCGLMVATLLDVDVVHDGDVYHSPMRRTVDASPGYNVAGNSAPKRCDRFEGGKMSVNEYSEMLHDQELHARLVLLFA